MIYWKSCASRCKQVQVICMTSFKLCTLVILHLQYEQWIQLCLSIFFTLFYRSSNNSNCCVVEFMPFLDDSLQKYHHLCCTTGALLGFQNCGCRIVDVFQNIDVITCKWKFFPQIRSTKAIFRKICGCREWIFQICGCSCTHCTRANKAPADTSRNSCVEETEIWYHTANVYSALQ